MLSETEYLLSRSSTLPGYVCVWGGEGESRAMRSRVSSIVQCTCVCVYLRREEPTGKQLRILVGFSAEAGEA